MPNAPSNPPPNVERGDESVAATKFGIYIARSPGTKPTIEDEQKTWRLLSITHHAGSQLMEAQIEADLDARGDRIEDLIPTQHTNRQIEIWTLKDPAPEPDDETTTTEEGGDDTPDADPRDVPLFWGEVLDQRTQLVRGVERITITCRPEPYLFGPPIRGQLVRNPHGGSSRLTHHDPVFNPVIDGVPLNTKFVAAADDDEPEDFPVWIDPESIRTANAESHQAGGADPWTLGDIVETLCWWRNEDEEHIRNPPRSLIDRQITDPPKVQNLDLSRGAYLPELLDRTLHPYGWQWCLRIFKDGDEARPAIWIYKRGEGDEKTLDLQPIDETLDREETNLLELDLTYSIARLANVIRAQGSLVQREVTVPLYRAWDQEDDGNHSHSNVDNPIGRKFAANEAGDYTDIRDEITDVPFFGTEFVAKRRVLEDCLTWADAEQIERLPPVLEYSKDDGDNWLPVPEEWGYRLLATEIGIYFTGQDNNRGDAGIPPEALNTSILWRITGTITGDDRIEYTSDRREDSPNSNELEMFLDLSDRYHDRQRETSGEFASALTASADEQDDTDALEEFVESIADKHAAALVDVLPPLEGISLDYRLGDIITEVRGRNISLARTTRDADEPRYLQIVGIHWQNTPEQRTQLIVRPYEV
ncbi:Uncharacterized protein SCF082_LOCUS52103 [Durusdinium trenchii]|uniref:Uncharacterized protein n=1 Tax=Durusdinium trenchii TaxID=1381693 RepID=A0ABP0SJM8_9DINO